MDGPDRLRYYSGRSGTLEPRIEEGRIAEESAPRENSRRNPANFLISSRYRGLEARIEARHVGNRSRVDCEG